ncbi:serine hydrolase domain-containing protein [Lacipirellula sp.]|uniref:serine hydrolase domain-containing protein n=1 Tax=Lacipirellula sp. TaxID=2691419 RepID=UPI003D11D3B2
MLPLRRVFPQSVAIAALVCLMASPTPATAKPKYDGVIEEGAKGKRIVAAVREAHKEDGFTGAVLAAEKGKVIAAVSVGDVDGKPFDPSTLFEIASCTKSFTAVAILKLAEEGKLSLDDPISKHLPGIPDNCQEITVRHLLQHTSGIPGKNSTGSGTDLAKVLPTFLEGGPLTTPGEKHEYWNQGYSLLSEVIANASGKPYTEYCREAIFTPCKMTSTCFTGDKAPPKVTVAVGKSTGGDPRSALDHPYGEYGFQYRGMGGIVTNLVDLWRFDRALKSGKLLNATSLAQMTLPGPDDYALGWRVVELDEKHTVHEHSGKVRGFLASVRRDPERDGCLIILANNDDDTAFDLVKEKCEAILAGEKPGAAKGLDKKLAKELIGKYTDAKGRTMVITLVAGHIRATIDWFGPKTYCVVNPGKEGVLDLDQLVSYPPLKTKPMNKLTVERDAEGKIASVTISDMDPKLQFDRAK